MLTRSRSSSERLMLQAMKYKPLDDLEMFELLQAAYPEKFADELSGWEAEAEQELDILRAKVATEI